jgi:glycosyltransferase involved in cell wall biosynthesis
MRIVFITTNAYPPEAFGGCGVNTHALCRVLLARSHDVAVLSDLRAGGWRDVKQRSRRFLFGQEPLSCDRGLGYPVFRRRRPWEAVDDLCQAVNPNVVVVQSGPQMVPLAQEFSRRRMPTIIYLHDAEFHVLDGDCVEDPFFRYLVSSNFLKDQLYQFRRVRSESVPPLILPEDYFVESKRRTVTFVNPRPHKGVDVALHLARRRPDIPFDFVESWPLAAEEFRRLASEARRLGNIRLRRSSGNMKAIYAHSKLMLVPSRCEEAWGRIVTEAQMSGIPALASEIGGLPEAVGEAGILVGRLAPLSEWEAALSRLWDQPDQYDRYAQAALRRAKSPELQPECILDRVLGAIYDLGVGVPEMTARALDNRPAADRLRAMQSRPSARSA